MNFYLLRLKNVGVTHRLVSNWNNYIISNILESDENVSDFFCHCIVDANN